MKLKEHNTGYIITYYTFQETDSVDLSDKFTKDTLRMEYRNTGILPNSNAVEERLKEIMKLPNYYNHHIATVKYVKGKNT